MFNHGLIQFYIRPFHWEKKWHWKWRREIDIAFGPFGFEVIWD